MLRGHLILGALRAQIGDWVYYITSMKMKDLAQRVERAQLFYSSKTMQDLLQRSITESRSSEISIYLRTQQQRFFNALVIGTYGGNPKWSEFEVEKILPIEYEIPDYVEGTIGFLILEGTENFFPIDGQHRIEGIRLAIEQQPEIGNEDLCVIFVKGISGQSKNEDPEGFERTRRLFTTLNRYAKPVNKKDIIALDEDDAIAIITRRLVEEYPLFIEKTSIKGASSIPRSDTTSFTSIIALYDGLDLYHKRGSLNSWKTFKKFFPGEPRITELFDSSVEFWDCMCEHFSPLLEIKNSRPEEDVASSYRNNDGGHLLYRPIGLLICIKIIRLLMDHNELSSEEAIERISNVQMNLSESPWAHLIWNPLSRRMITRGPPKRAAERILYYSVGGDLSILNSSLEALKEDIAALQNVDVSSITLPMFI